MNSHSAKLRADAERIWRAGVAAVLPERLIPENVRVDGDWLAVDDELLDLRSIGRIAIVGAGKAAGAMGVALEKALGSRLLQDKQVSGWINVPADCVVPTQRVHLHAARAPGVNEPSAEGVEGTRRILEIVSSLGPDDVCFCLLTGGGSALLPAPVPEISLDDKIRLTRLISGAGANIEQLNTVRQNLSLVKGGGLARACRAGRLITLVISDVLGDPLDLIGSGPTVQSKSTASDALGVLEQLGLARESSLRGIVEYLRGRAGEQSTLQAKDKQFKPTADVTNLILGNNATAVDGAGVEAERLGYSHAMISARKSEGAAEEIGCHLASMAVKMRDNPGPDCLISGGEPTVKLIDERRRGKGGRNQQLALAALSELGDSERICLLSGGTDGEDGPTDAAGAIVDAEVVRAAAKASLDANDYLARNDAYTFFQKCGGLLKTGPTGTNVCDLRVVVVVRGSPDPALASTEGLQD
jgi:glycerate 2-kinase